MKQRFFNADSLSNYDKISTIFYLVLTFIISKITKVFSDPEGQNIVVFIYAFSSPLLLYAFSYKSLRNIKIFIFWVFIGLYHLYLHSQLTNYPAINYKISSAAKGLQFTIYFVILFQILRLIHLRLFGYELVSLNNGMSKTDIWENRVIKLPDIICFYIYFILWILLTIII